jgi:hypothetical protein
MELSLVESLEALGCACVVDSESIANPQEKHGGSGHADYVKLFTSELLPMDRRIRSLGS